MTSLVFPAPPKAQSNNAAATENIYVVYNNWCSQLPPNFKIIATTATRPQNVGCMAMLLWFHMWQGRETKPRHPFWAGFWGSAGNRSARRRQVGISPPSCSHCNSDKSDAFGPRFKTPHAKILRIVGQSPLRCHANWLLPACPANLITHVGDWATSAQASSTFAARSGEASDKSP